MTFKNMTVFDRNGYPAVYLPTHHKAGETGLVYVHVLVAEEMLGRELNSEEIVHHCNKDRYDYNVVNLMIFASNKDHSTYHSCIDNGLDFELQCINKVYRCKRLTSKFTMCPVCGGQTRNHRNQLCAKCSLKIRRKNIPEKEILLEDLHHFTSFCAIGRKYGVSDVAVKKWCKMYGLSHYSSFWKNYSKQ